ncbi:MAG: group II intron reverse transcriptase/maturase [Deltaproteobacteria bacterium]|nr:group II intron reverse transcriptase/maturase [Deltaproteobacteria bacterium]
MTGTKGLEDISTRQQRIAELAKRFETLTTLNHHVDMTWMREAYGRTRKDGATGIDGQSAAEYERELEVNLQSLLERAKAGTYRAPAVRRVHIPKGNGDTRPIGIPTFEDKVLQQAVKMVLEPIYEQDFLPCSFGFRPGRNTHQCIEELRDAARKIAGGWVLDVDIKKFFDSIPRPQLLEVLNQRVRDGVISRLVAKWLHAGVMEDGATTYPETGTPQGGVISPLLANIYLHEVMDAWFERDVRPRMKGQAHLFRYADDAVMLFEKEEDARRVLAVLPKRLEKYGLTLHPEKTRLVRFKRPDRDRTDADGDGGAGPGTFDFLGFTHLWTRMTNGHWVILRRTARDRFTRAVKKAWLWLKSNRHRPLVEQQQGLAQRLRGHYNYYAIRGNKNRAWSLLRLVTRAWKMWLERRSDKAGMGWRRYRAILKRFPLPTPAASS